MQLEEACFGSSGSCVSVRLVPRCVMPTSGSWSNNVEPCRSRTDRRVLALLKVRDLCPVTSHDPSKTGPASRDRPLTSRPVRRFKSVQVRPMLGRPALQVTRPALQGLRREGQRPRCE